VHLVGLINVGHDGTVVSTRGLYLLRAALKVCYSMPMPLLLCPPSAVCMCAALYEPRPQL